MLDVINNNDYLVHSMPFLYWLYLFQQNPNFYVLMILIGYGCFIIFQWVIRLYIINKIKKSKNYNTKNLAIFLRNPLRIFFVFGLVAIGFFSWIFMLFNKKDSYILGLIIFYSLGLLFEYFVVSIVHGKKINEISYFMLRGKK